MKLYGSLLFLSLTTTLTLLAPPEDQANKSEELVVVKKFE